MSRNYKQYFISAEEIWKKNLENVKRFIDTNNQRPSSTSNNSEEKQLGCWISSQKTHYQNNERIMRNDEMRKMWEKFVTDDNYKQYFRSAEEIWKNKLQEVKEFIDTNHKLPNHHSKNSEEKILGWWIRTQLINYKNNKEIMRNDEIREMWNEFVNSE